MVGGKVALNDDCCCATGCTCPREVTEISGFTMVVTVTSTSFPGCTSTATWVRIDSDVTFSDEDPKQFKLYLANCEFGRGQIFWEDNRFTPSISTFCVGGGLAGSLTFNGCCTFFTDSDGVVTITLNFFASEDGSGCVATLGDTDYTMDVCDLSDLLGTLSVHNTCVSGGVTYTVDGSVTWF